MTSVSSHRAKTRIAASFPPAIYAEHSVLWVKRMVTCSLLSCRAPSFYLITHVMQQTHATTAHTTQSSQSSVAPCGVRSNTRHCHLVAESSSPQSPTPASTFTVPLPLPPFPTLLLNTVNVPSFGPSSHCSLDSLLSCCSSPLSPLPPAASMERVHHEKSPVMEMRLTRSRARSLERQAEKQQQQQQRAQRATSTDNRAGQREEERREQEVDQLPSSKGDNVFQADTKKDSDSDSGSMPPPAPKLSPTSAAKANTVRAESLSEELAQARKEEGLSEFAGEHPITPAPLQPTPHSTTSSPTSTMASTTTAVPTTEAGQPAQPTHVAEAMQPQQWERKVKPNNRKRKGVVKDVRLKVTDETEGQRGREEERKETPVSYREEMKDVSHPDEDNRSLFSTALPSPLSPVESKESPLEWDKHDSALSFDSTSFSRTQPTYSSDVDDDKALAWQLQQEEYDAAAAARSIHTFLADMSYQPAWLRLSLAVCLVINVLLPLVFIPNTTAMVTLVCQVLQLGFAHWLYRVYDFTPHLFYSCALLLPSLLYMVDAHVLQTGWSDVLLLGGAVVRRPSLLLDGVVQLYIWQWMSAAVQAVELIGGMWLALKVR